MPPMDYDELPQFEPIRRRFPARKAANKRRRAGHSCLHKKGYNTNGQAMHILSIEIARTPNLSIYHCPDCGKWHLTHRRQQPDQRAW